MKVLLALATIPIAASLLFLPDSSLDKHTAEMKKAQSITIVFTVNKIGGAPEEQTLSLSKPDRFRWESPTRLVVGNGKSILALDKAKNTYTEVPQTPESLKKALGDDAVWAWSAFFDADFASTLANVKRGSTRKVRNISVTEVEVIRKDTRAFNVYVDEATGIVRGSTYEASDKSQWLVLAKELKPSDKPADEAVVAAKIPEGAKKADEAAASPGEKLAFADVGPIFTRNCAGCHSGPGAKAGVDLSDYAGIKRQVTPGNADASRIVRIIRRGKMPPGGPLPKADIDRIAQWVNDGANP